MTALDPSTIIPERILAAPPRLRFGGLVAGLGEGVVSLLLNVVILTALVHLAFSNRPVAEPQVISVEIVPEQQTPAGGAGGGSGSGSAAQGRPSRAAIPASGSRPAEASTSLKSDAAKPVERTTEPQPSAADVKEARPPPADTGTDPAPRLIETPADPQQAAQQADKNVVANAEQKPADTPKPVEQPAPPAPPVLATPNAAAPPVPEAVSTPDTRTPAPPVSAEAQREAENTAKLAAALPYAQSFAPDMRRAAVSGTGSSTSIKYRGAVYATFRRADDLVEAARAQHLRGQTVVEFSIDDQGALSGIRVAISSGDSAVDETALNIIRRSAPFPPPPPGAQHTFSPAIRLGLDDQ